MFVSDRNDFHTFAQERKFVFIDGEVHPALISFLKTATHDLKRRTRRNLWKQFALINSIRKVRSESKNSDEAIARSYGQEYGGDGAGYGYVSAILSPEGFGLITGLQAETIHTLQVIDVGAGSNEFLRFCRDTLGVPSSQLHGSDISHASRNIIESDGFAGHLGRLEDLDLKGKSFDMAYLSYFIDYDTNQSATFDAAIDLIKPGGLIVLEGLFPVRPFGLLEKDTGTYSFLTKGVSAKEDIELVMESFMRLGKMKGRGVSLSRVLKTHRFVHSSYGFHRLPSYFLTFSVTD